MAVSGAKGDRHQVEAVLHKPARQARAVSAAARLHRPPPTHMHPQPAPPAHTHAQRGPTWCAVMSTPGRMPRTASAATAALLCPTCRLRNRNCRLRLLVSMVSRSICGQGEEELQFNGWGSAWQTADEGIAENGRVGQRAREFAGHSARPERGWRPPLVFPRPGAPACGHAPPQCG